MGFKFGQHDVSSRIICENELAFCFPSNSPIVPGHVLICPKRIVPKYEDLSASEKSAVEDLRVLIKAALARAFGARGFNYAWNEESIGGQSVPHFHLHIVPRKEGDAGVHSYEPREFLYRPGVRPTTPDEELASIAGQIRSALTS